MTFYEAALRILEEAGSPLHSLEITKRSLDKGLLSHVGKTPEVTMLSRLAAMAKRSRERKIMVTARDTFALTDWMLAEDDAALAATGVLDANPEEDLPPMRPVERHPEPRAEYLRSIGRQAERKRRGDEDGRRKKYPPISEVAFELLTESQSALVPSELLARMKTRELVQDELGTGAMLEALAGDNQQRLDQNRRPQFAAVRSEGGELQLSVDAGPVEGGLSLVDLQAAFCSAAQLPFENGRVVLRSHRRAAAEVGAVASSVIASPEDAALVSTAKTAVRDARRSMARLFRRKLTELDSGTFEKACVRLLHGLHFRELKVARRSKEGPLLTARRKDGSLELRYAIRIMKSGSTERRNVQELRRDLGHHGAQLGLVISAGDARGDARAEATASGALVMLWCGDALAEKFFEAQVGVSVTQIELFDIDETFFSQAKLDADEASKRREERHRERQGGERVSSDARPTPTGNEQSSDSAPTPPMGDAGAEAAAPAPAPLAAPIGAGPGDDGEEGDDDEGPEEGGSEVAAGAAGAEGAEGGRRRRRRRRRRRGGANRPEGAQAAGAPGSPTAPRASAPRTGEVAVAAEAAPAPESVAAAAPAELAAAAPAEPAAAAPAEPAAAAPAEPPTGDSGPA